MAAAATPQTTATPAAAAAAAPAVKDEKKVQPAKPKNTSVADALTLPPLIDLWALEAKDLMGSKPEAYVKVFLVDESGADLKQDKNVAEFRSEVVAGRNPVWITKPAAPEPAKDGRIKPVAEPDATFSHKDAPKLCLEARVVRVEVWGKAFFGDDFLGQVELKLADVPQLAGDVKEALAADRVHKQWYDLKEKATKKAKVSGQINIKIAYKSGELKKKEAEDKLKGISNTYKKERMETAAADLGEKKKRDEEEKAFITSLSKEANHVKKILGQTMATSQRWKGVITMDPHPTTKAGGSRHFLDFVVNRHLVVVAGDAKTSTAPRHVPGYMTLAALQTGEKQETVELCLRDREVKTEAGKDKDGKDVPATQKMVTTATITPHADAFMREAVKRFQEQSAIEAKKRAEALEEAKKRGEDTSLLSVGGDTPSSSGSIKGAKNLEEMFAGMVRLNGNFNDSLDELHGTVHDVQPDHVLAGDDALGAVKGSFVLMVGARYEAALKVQQAAREDKKKKEHEEEQKRFAAETATWLDALDARLKPAVTALSTGSVWHGFITTGKDAKDKKEGKYELKVLYRNKETAHGSHVAVRPTAFGHNQPIRIEVVSADVEITDAKAAADAKAAGTGYNLPGATGSAATKVYRSEVRVQYEDKDQKYRGVYDKENGQIIGQLFAQSDALLATPIATFALASAAGKAIQPSVVAAPAPAPTAAAAAPVAAAAATPAPAATASAATPAAK